MTLRQTKLLSALSVISGRSWMSANVGYGDVPATNAADAPRCQHFLWPFRPCGVCLLAVGRRGYFFP